jgi:hypothetical protein
MMIINLGNKIEEAAYIAQRILLGCQKEKVGDHLIGNRGLRDDDNTTIKTHEVNSEKKSTGQNAVAGIDLAQVYAHNSIYLAVQD